MCESIRVLQIDSGTDSERSSLVTGWGDDRFGVDAVTEPTTALERLASSEYDCVVSAHDLSGMTGLELFRRVRETEPGLPFILYSDSSSEHVACEAITAGVIDYVTPDDESLAARVEAVVSGGEQGIAERLHRLEELIRTVPTAIIRVDTSGEIVFANLRARTILGFEEQSIQRSYDDPSWEIRDLDGERIPDEKLPVQQVLRSGEPVEGYRHSIRRPDGDRRIVEVSAAPLFDSQEAIESVVLTLTDSTPRDRRGTAFEALHDIATTIQREETVEAVCERTVAAAADILEFDTCSVMIREGEWLLPYAVSEDTPPDGVQRMRIDEGLAGKTFQTGESEIVERVPDNDDVKPAKESYRSGISVPIGEHGVFQAVSTDMGAFTDEDIEFAELLLSHTESKIEQLEREAELRRQNERLDEFAGIISHDLSNPLNVAQLQLELVRESVDHERLAAIDQAHDRMRTLIDALLTLARNRDPLEQTEQVDLAAVAEQSLATLGTESVTLSVEADVVISADRDLVQILLENLLKNSAEHGTGDDPEGSAVVRIGLLQEGFFFEDDGPGIPDDIRSEMFDLGVSSDANGTGIGLKIVTEIVEAHGWQIDVTESDDGGARFEITGIRTDA